MAHKRDKPGKSCCKCVLQKTMKGADKAIVAKSFGKWESGSLRSRTVEKPDEPSEESKGENLSNCTCVAPRRGKKAAGKSTRFSYFRSVRGRRVSPLVFFLWQFLIITAAAIILFFFSFFIFPLLRVTLWPCHIRRTNKPHCWAGEFLLRQSVSPMIQRCQEKKTKQKIANTKTVTGAREKERSE